MFPNNLGEITGYAAVMVPAQPHDDAPAQIGIDDALDRRDAVEHRVRPARPQSPVVFKIPSLLAKTVRIVTDRHLDAQIGIVRVDVAMPFGAPRERLAPGEGKGACGRCRRSGSLQCLIFT